MSHLLPCLAPLEPARPSARRSRPPLACTTPSGDLRCGGLAPVTFWLTPAPNCPCTRICGCMLTGASTNLSAVDELDMWRAPCLVHSLDHGSLSWHRNRHIHDRRVMNSIKRLNLRNFDCLLGCRDEHLASRHNWHIHSPLLHSFLGHLHNSTAGCSGTSMFCSNGALLNALVRKRHRFL